MRRQSVWKPGLEALRNHVDAGRSRLAAELGTLSLAALPTMAEADADLEAAASSLADARAALVGPEAEHHRAATAQRNAVTVAGQTRSTLTVLEQEEDAALTAEADDALAIRMTAAQANLIGRRGLVVDTQRDKPADTVEGMDARIKRSEGAGTSRLDTIRRPREELAGLTTRIRLDEGEGLVLALLRDTLSEAEREARGRYVAPVLRRMTP